MPNPSGLMNGEERAICARFRRARKKAGLTVRRTAELLGVSFDVAASLEYARTPLKLGLALRAARLQLPGAPFAFLAASLGDCRGLPQEILFSKASKLSATKAMPAAAIRAALPAVAAEISRHANHLAPDAREKARCDFTRGFVCAIAALLFSHGNSTEVKDLVRCAGSTEDILRHADAEDIEKLRAAGYLAPTAPAK